MNCIVLMIYLNLREPTICNISLCLVLQLRVGLSADVVPGGKPGPRRTKSFVIADTVGVSLQRKGDLMANQETCLSSLRGETLPQVEVFFN